jgi:hypothetical protein
MIVQKGLTVGCIVKAPRFKKQGAVLLVPKIKTSYGPETIGGFVVD